MDYREPYRKSVVQIERLEAQVSNLESTIGSLRKQVKELSAEERLISAQAQLSATMMEARSFEKCWGWRIELDKERRDKKSKNEGSK